MFQIGHYRRRGRRLPDYLPWAGLVAPGCVLNKDGAFMRVVDFRGPDLESSTQNELTIYAQQLNRVFKRAGTGWCYHIEAARHESTTYPDTQWTNVAAGMVDDERRSQFAAERVHFETNYRLSVAYLPPTETVNRAANLFLTDDATANLTVNYDHHLSRFIEETDTLFAFLADIFRHCSPLDNDGVVTYLHSCVSTNRQGVASPEVPFYLDGLLCDMPFVGGLHPRLGDHYLKTISIRDFGTTQTPALLDELNSLTLPFRWVTRFLTMDKKDAIAEITAMRRNWFAKRKGIRALIGETLFKTEPLLEDSSAVDRAKDADHALREAGDDRAAYGYITTTITVSDPNPGVVMDMAREIQRVAANAQLVAEIETLNAVEAWLGSLPGHAYADIRRPMVSTKNLARLMPASAIWAGPLRNEHLNGPPLLYAHTRGSTPFRLTTHHDDLGHSILIGPPGAGKSFFLSLMALQWLRYPEAQVLIIDKDRSSRAATLCAGGQFFDIGQHDGLGFQPLADIDQPDERTWAQEWLLGLYENEKLPITPELKISLWSALLTLASRSTEHRTLTTLHGLLQEPPLKHALAPYTVAGAYGHILDRQTNTLTRSPWQAFELGQLFDRPSIMAPTLHYLFHVFAQRFDGRPTLLIIDEGWLFLNYPTMADQIKEWLKVLRKKNVSVVFATQSIADATDSPIFSTLVEAIPTRIFLANVHAREPRITPFYHSLGLNERQIDLIATAHSKRDYYFSNPFGNRLFELSPGPLALAICGSSSPSDHLLLDRLEKTSPAEQFLRNFLAAKSPRTAKEAA